MTILESKPVLLRSQIFIKKKSIGLVTARLAITGTKQLPESNNEIDRTQPTVPLSYTSASPENYTHSHHVPFHL
jgi:hypothetical protein